MNKASRRGWQRLLALALILALAAGCPESVARIGIPLAYGLTGLCLALLVSPTLVSAVAGFVVGCVLGAAVYNNSLKGQMYERQTPAPWPPPPPPKR